MKAQVTVFMILGLVILVAFTMTLYIVSYRQVKESAHQMPQSVIKRTNIEAVRAYATDCVSSSASEALELLGKQGGRLYKSQGSIVKDPTDVIKYDNVDVSYSIIPPVGNVGPYTALVPDYPWIDFPWIVKQGNTTEWFYGYFGLPDFPPLYDFSPNSVQEMLETYIENKLPFCLDPERFKALSFDMGKPYVRMIIAKNITQLYTEEFVSFDVDWPIVVTDVDGFKAELRDFVVNYPVSFGNIYYHAKSLIDSDVSQVGFDPRDYRGFDVSVLNNVKNHDDIIVFTDKRSRLIGKPLSFYIARKNRPPALAKIANFVSLQEFCIGTRFAVYENRLTASNNQLNYEITAFDPDEDIITFHLSPADPKLLANSMTLRIIARDGGGLEDYEDVVIYGVACG